VTPAADHVDFSFGPASGLTSIRGGRSVIAVHGERGRQHQLSYRDLYTRFARVAPARTMARA
jgi:hypothetical protein